MSKIELFIVVQMTIRGEKPLPGTCRAKKKWAIEAALDVLTLGGTEWADLRRLHKLRCVPCTVEWKHQGHVLERKPKP